MILELYGLPGTGKSTYAKVLGEKLKLPVVTTATPTEQIVYGSLFLCTHLRFAGWTFYYSLFYSHHIRYALRSCLFKRGALYVKAKRTGGVLDESLYMNTLSLFGRKATKKQIARYIPLLPRDHTVIVLSEPFEILEMRDKTREISPRRHLTGDTRKAWWKDWVHNDQIVRSLLLSPENDFVLSKETFEYTILDNYPKTDRVSS